MLLSIRNATVHYGKAIALDNVSLGVPEGSIVSIIGANGSGKSTLLKAISGLVPITSGEILFENRRIDGMKAYDIVRLGIVQIPEGRRLFPYITVMNNLKLGASLRKDKPGIEKDFKEVFEYFPILWERRNQNAGTLSGGEQQMLAIARSLMSGPKLLAMDEPSLALSPTLVKSLVSVIKQINSRGVTVLLVEQNVALALKVSEHSYALQVGKVILAGKTETLKDNETIRKAYLGG